MRLEYLIIKDKDVLPNVEKVVGKDSYKAEFYRKELKKINQDLFIIETKTNNHEDAKYLSKINKIIEENFPFKLIKSESSEYFNKNLFPLINSFERILRNLLYLAINRTPENELDKAKIEKIEKVSFGEIFELLFIDDNYNNVIKKKITDKSSRFTKSSLMTMIDVPEDTLWNRLFGNESMQKLSFNFEEIRQLRNDVMHARNMDNERYTRAKKLYTDINNEITQMIQNLTEDEGVLSSEYRNRLAMELSKSLEKIPTIKIEASEDLINALNQINKAFSIDPLVLKPLQVALEVLRTNIDDSADELAKALNLLIPVV